MSPLLFLIPIALTLGGLGLFAFLWALRDGQYEDLDGAAERIFLDDDDPQTFHERQQDSSHDKET